MKEILNVGIIQTDLFWENPEKNLQNFTDKINQIKEAVDIVVLPEMFTTGFTMNQEFMAELMNGKTIEWMKKTAAEKNIVITGSLVIREKLNYYNRLILMCPDGSFEYYDKRNLFRMGKEDQYYSPGSKKLISKCSGWNIKPLICYDLRFPVWSRNQEDYDILIYVANWPKARRELWEILLKARAIENQAFVVGVGRIGKDGMGISYSGDSMVIDPKGKIISKTKPYEDSIEVISISAKELLDLRTKFPVALDADKFEILAKE